MNDQKTVKRQISETCRLIEFYKKNPKLQVEDLNECNALLQKALATLQTTEKVQKD